MGGDDSSTKKNPTVLWAQRADVLFLTIEVPDVDKESAIVKVYQYTYIHTS